MVAFHQKSTLTDHTTTENHLIDWEGVKVLDRESHRRRRLVKEVIWICKNKAAINRDEDNYEIPHGSTDEVVLIRQ